MGDIQPPRKVLPIAAVFSRHDEAFDWAYDRMTSRFGPLLARSEPFAFDQTTYYEASMGPGLKKELWAFDALADPAALPDVKIAANALEAQFAAERNYTEPRPLNIDPGYLTEAKLVLATTKDRDHRIYLRDGIYAEVTLYYHAKAWQSRPWTYADYQQPEYHQFLTQCRDRLREKLGKVL